MHREDLLLVVLVAGCVAQGHIWAIAIAAPYFILAYGFHVAHAWLNWRIRASDRRIAQLREQLAALDEQG